MRHFLIAGASGFTWAPGQSQDTEPAFLCLNNEDLVNTTERIFIFAKVPLIWYLHPKHGFISAQQETNT